MNARATIFLFAPLALAPLAGRPRFQPAKDSATTKTFEVAMAMELLSFEVVMGGQPVPSEYLPKMEFELNDEQRVVVTDRYLALRADGPERLARRYDEIAESTHVRVAVDGEVDTDADGRGESPLEGREVVFQWSPASGLCLPSFGEDRGDSPLLADLVEDMDLRAFLPGDDVAEGETWKLPAEAFAALLYPGGDLKVERNDEHVPKDAELAPLEGSVQVTWAGTRSVDGRELAVLEVEARVVTVLSYETSLDDVPVADGAADETHSTTVDVEGEILWDLAAGRVHGAELTGEATLVMHTVKQVEGDADPGYEHRFTLAGPWRATLSTAPAE